MSLFLARQRRRLDPLVEASCAPLIEPPGRPPKPPEPTGRVRRSKQTEELRHAEHRQPHQRQKYGTERHSDGQPMDLVEGQAFVGRLGGLVGWHCNLGHGVNSSKALRSRSRSAASRTARSRLALRATLDPVPRQRMSVCPRGSATKGHTRSHQAATRHLNGRGPALSSPAARPNPSVESRPNGGPPDPPRAAAGREGVGPGVS